MNEEEIIDILENVFIFKNTNDNFTRLDLDTIKGLLDLYKQEKEERRKADRNFDEITIKMAKLDTELQNEKEKNKKLEEDIKVCEIMEKSHKKEIDQLILKLNKSLEVIDLMAKDIWESDDWTTCEAIKLMEDCYADTLADGKFCGKDCIKEYYFKKARGKEDDK